MRHNEHKEHESKQEIFEYNSDKIQLPINILTIQARHEDSSDLLVMVEVVIDGFSLYLL
jgi:hypothetical protein